tara:strand:- start:5418 stop:6041 length:624 start_codon:yes stop_codon:yes gene_type:complete
MIPILLAGGGGHCRSCIDVIELNGGYEIIGLVKSDSAGVIDNSLRYPVVGSDKDLPILIKNCPNILIAIGQIKSPDARIKLYNYLKSINANLPFIYSPLSYISPNANIGKGTIVMHAAIVNAGAKISENCIINTHSLIEHDVEIKAHCHVSTAAKINGNVKIGEGCFIGSGAILREGIEIGSGSVIGAGQIVMNDLPSKTLFTGNLK